MLHSLGSNAEKTFFVAIASNAANISIFVDKISGSRKIFTD